MTESECVSKNVYEWYERREVWMYKVLVASKKSNNNIKPFGYTQIIFMFSTFLVA